MANPYKAPAHDKGDPYRHWTDEYKLKRLRRYSIAIICYYLAVPIWITILIRNYMAGFGLPWWKVGIAVSTFILTTCAALLVRHYRRHIVQRMQRQQSARVSDKQQVVSE